MYNFTDTTATPAPVQGLETAWRGLKLEAATNRRFRTLSVTGRELLGPEVMSSPIVGGAGDWLDVSRLPARTIKVTGLIYPEACGVLQRVLGTAQGGLSFSDEPYTWHAVPLGITEPAEGIYWPTGTIIAIDFLALDPYKYGAPQSGVTIPESWRGLHRPDIITGTCRQSGTVAKFMSPTRTMTINGTFTAGDVITVNFANSYIAQNNSSITAGLDITSDFLDFFMKPGESLSFSLGTVTMSFRERRL